MIFVVKKVKSVEYKIQKIHFFFCLSAQLFLLYLIYIKSGLANCDESAGPRARVPHTLPLRRTCSLHLVLYHKQFLTDLNYQ